MSALVVPVAAAIVTLAFVGLELRDPAFRASWASDRRRRRRNAAFLAANLVTMVVLNALTHAVAAVVPPLLVWSGPAVVEVLACLVVAELVNWLSHAAKHAHPWLWRFHAPHHVETHYSVNLTLHTHGVEVVVTGAVMAAVLALFGFSRVAVDAFALTYYAANLYKHCSARLSLGPLDWLVVSPAYHRLHHAVAGEAGADLQGKNYGSVLTIFDVLFGTARFPTRGSDPFALPVGVATREPFGFVDEMLAPLRAPRPPALAPVPVRSDRPDRPR